MYILKGKFKDQDVYFQKFEDQMLFGTMFQVRHCSEVIEGARFFSVEELEEAKDICNETNNAFKIYPVCSSCGHEYDGQPTLAIKDNKANICDKCSIKH